MHISVSKHLVFTYNRNIVLDVARRNTTITSNARIQVDGHSPSVTNILNWMLMPQVEILGRFSIL